MTNEEAIEYLYDIQTDAVYNILSEEKEAIEMAIQALESQKTAHFIGFENPNYSPFDNDIFNPKVLLKCSECGNAILSMFAYCPMCGRKLTEVENDE